MTKLKQNTTATPDVQREMAEWLSKLVEGVEAIARGRTVSTSREGFKPWGRVYMFDAMLGVDSGTARPLSKAEGEAWLARPENERLRAAQGDETEAEYKARLGSALGDQAVNRFVSEAQVARGIRASKLKARGAWMGAIGVAAIGHDTATVCRAVYREYTLLMLTDGATAQERAYHHALAGIEKVGKRLSVTDSQVREACSALAARIGPCPRPVVRKVGKPRSGRGDSAIQLRCDSETCATRAHRQVVSKKLLAAMLGLNPDTMGVADGQSVRLCGAADPTKRGDYCHGAVRVFVPQTVEAGAAGFRYSAPGDQMDEPATEPATEGATEAPPVTH